MREFKMKKVFAVFMGGMGLFIVARGIEHLKAQDSPVIFTIVMMVLGVLFIACGYYEFMRKSTTTPDK